MMGDEKQPDPGLKKAGKIMFFLVWVLVLVMMTMLFAKWENNQKNPNQDPLSVVNADGTKILVLHRNTYHSYIVSGLINDYPVTFMLDTGASDVVIPEALAEKCGLVKGISLVARTANGNVTVFATTIKTLQLGQITLNNVPASINPGMDASDEVLLGMSALRNLDLQQSGDTITLTQNRKKNDR